MFIRKTRRRRRNVPTILETRTHSSYMLDEWPLIIHHCHMHAQSIVYPSYMVVLPGPTTHSYTPHTFTSYPKRPSFWLTICVCVCGNAVQRRRRTQLADGDALRIAPQRDLQHQAHSICKQKRNIAHFTLREVTSFHHRFPLRRYLIEASRNVTLIFSRLFWTIACVSNSNQSVSNLSKTRVSVHLSYRSLICNSTKYSLRGHSRCGTGVALWSAATKNSRSQTSASTIERKRGSETVQFDIVHVSLSPLWILTRPQRAHQCCVRVYTIYKCAIECTGCDLNKSRCRTRFFRVLFIDVLVSFVSLSFHRANKL